MAVMNVTTVGYEFGFGEETRIYAESYLGETDESRKRSIAELRRWLTEEEPALSSRTEDYCILIFLRGCKFKLDKTKHKLKNYFALIDETPQWFADRDPLRTEIRDLLTLGVFVPLRKLHDNKLVVIIRTAIHDPKLHKQDDVFKTGMMLLDIAMKEAEIATIYGVIAVLDMKGVGLAHAKQLPPHVVKKLVCAWKNYHCKPKNFEFVNAPRYINVMLKIFKMFMSEKMKSRIGVHFGGIESLHKIVPPSVLPIEYGGFESNMEELVFYWHKKAIEYRDYVKTNTPNTENKF